MPFCKKRLIGAFKTASPKASLLMAALMIADLLAYPPIDWFAIVSRSFHVLAMALAFAAGVSRMKKIKIKTIRLNPPYLIALILIYITSGEKILIVKIHQYKIYECNIK